MWTSLPRDLILVEMGMGRTRPSSARHILSQNLKRLRLSKGLSQERLAALASLHPNYVGSVERAERNISIDNIEKIAAALGVPTSRLLSMPKARGK